MTSGYAGLAGSIYIPASENKKNKRATIPVSIPYVMLGTALLLFG
jgi:ammonia channel protein AmtB